MTRHVAIAVAACLLGPAVAGAEGWTGPEDVGPPAVSGARVAIRANGEAVAVWSALDRGLVAAVRSPSGDWMRPRLLVRDGAFDDMRAVQVAIADDGTAIAVWAQTRRSPAPWVVKASVRPPGGRFARPVTVARVARATRPEPRLTLRSGRAAIVWTSGDGAKLVWRTRRGHFTAPRQMPWGSEVDAALDRSGRLHVLFARPKSVSDYCPDNAVWTVSGRRGERFTAPRRVADESAMDLAIEIARDGDAIAVWRGFSCDRDQAEPPGATRVRAAIARAGHHFGAPRTLTPDGEAALGTRLAVGPHGDALVSWESPYVWVPPGTQPRVRAWVAARPAHGRFRAAQPLSPPGLNATPPALAVDRSGIATAAYMVDAAGGELHVARGPTTAPLPPAVPLAGPEDSPEFGQYGYAPELAAAGRRTMLLWARGQDHRLIAYAAGRR